MKAIGRTNWKTVRVKWYGGGHVGVTGAWHSSYDNAVLCCCGVVVYSSILLALNGALQHVVLAQAKR